MDRWVYIPSVILGLFFIVTYCLRCLRRDEKVDPAKAWGGERPPLVAREAAASGEKKT